MEQIIVMGVSVCCTTLTKDHWISLPALEFGVSMYCDSEHFSEKIIQWVFGPCKYIGWQKVIASCLIRDPKSFLQYRKSKQRLIIQQVKHWVVIWSQEYHINHIFFLNDLLCPIKPNESSVTHNDRKLNQSRTFTHHRSHVLKLEWLINIKCAVCNFFTVSNFFCWGPLNQNNKIDNLMIFSSSVRILPIKICHTSGRNHVHEQGDILV